MLLPPVKLRVLSLCPNPVWATLTPLELPVMDKVVELPVASPLTCPILTLLLPPTMLTVAVALSLMDPAPNVAESNPNNVPEVVGTVTSLVNDTPLPCITVTVLLLPPVILNVCVFSVP